MLFHIIIFVNVLWYIDENDCACMCVSDVNRCNIILYHLAVRVGVPVIDGALFSKPVQFFTCIYYKLLYDNYPLLYVD